VSKPNRKESFPWLLLLGLLGSIYLFWVLPLQIGLSAPKVEFTDK